MPVRVCVLPLQFERSYNLNKRNLHEREKYRRATKTKCSQSVLESRAIPLFLSGGGSTVEYQNFTFQNSTLLTLKLSDLTLIEFEGAWTLSGGPYMSV